MGLSDASWFAATVAILLGIYIGERILDIDFSVFLAKYHSSKVRDTP